MREHEWDLIDVADQLEYLPVATPREPDPKPRRYQVIQLEEGTGHVLATRILSRVDDGTSEFVVTDTVRITKNSDRWSYVSCKAKVVATGGFEVTRASGEKEYERCPTPRDRAKQGRRQ